MAVSFNSTEGNAEQG